MDFARRLTRPFRALAGALDSDRAAPLPHEGPRELREAAAAIAAMRDRLAIEAAERARMLTAIAHDLRTPLTGLRLRIEAASEPQRARMVADVERMQAMIGEVLAFARDAEAPVEVVDVRPLLAAIIEDMHQGSAIVRLLPGNDAQIVVPELTFRRAIENFAAQRGGLCGWGLAHHATGRHQCVHIDNRRWSRYPGRGSRAPAAPLRAGRCLPQS